MAKFSEGIWYAVKNSSYWDINTCTAEEADGPQGIGYPYNPHIAGVIFPRDFKHEEGKAAQLMAAAPEMRSALQRCEAFLKSQDLDEGEDIMSDMTTFEVIADTLATVRKALAKADGKVF